MTFEDDLGRRAGRLARLEQTVREAAAIRDVELRPNGRGRHGDGLDLVTLLGERIRTSNLAEAAEALVYTHTLRPFDGRFLGFDAEVDRAIDRPLED